MSPRLSVTKQGQSAPRRNVLCLFTCIALLTVAATAFAQFPSPISFGPPQTYTVGDYPRSVATGDFNGDSKLDLVVTNYTDSTISILLGNGDGTFQAPVNYAVGSDPISVAVGDFNGDGKPDLVVACNATSVLSVLLGNGDGTFQAAVTYVVGTYPNAVIVRDFNGDGKQDLVVANYDGTVSVLLGNGDGTFQPMVNYPDGTDLQSVAAGDFNGDGKLDLVTASYDGTVSVLLGNGDGTFQVVGNYVFDYAHFWATVGDLNGDGKPDLVVANGYSGDVSVLLGNGDGTFQPPVDYAATLWPSFITVADFNGDGKLDLVVAGFEACILLGWGDGTFQPALNYPAGSSPSSIAVGDFNGDGKLDMAVADYLGNSVTVLLNTTTGMGTSVALTSSANPSDPGQDVTLTAKVTSAQGTPTGTVTFVDGAISLGVETLSSGAATLATSELAVGSHWITGYYSGDSTYTANNSRPLVQTVTGPVAVSLAPDGLIFGDQQAGTFSAPQTVTLTNTSGSTLIISSITASGDFDPAYNCSATIAVDGSCLIGVTFTPTAAGTRTGSLMVADNAPGSPQSIPLVGTGTAGTPIPFVSPGSLTFGNQLVNTTSTAQAVTISNPGWATLNISSVAISSNFSQTNNCGSSLVVGGLCTFNVSFTPRTAGPLTGALTVTDNTHGITVTVSLSGTGQDFSFAPPSGSPTTSTVAPGATATYTLSVGGLGGFSGSVSFSCAGAPSEATCLVSPNPVTGGSTATNVTVTVTTTAPSVSAPRSRPVPPAPPLSPRVRGLWVLALLLAALAWAVGRRNQRGAGRWQFTVLLLAAGFLLTLALAGCGGGGGGGGTGPTQNPGTPAGTYNLTVTGTAGSGSSALSHNVTLTLTVS
jgi:hypothetical protein